MKKEQLNALDRIMKLSNLKSAIQEYFNYAYTIEWNKRKDSEFYIRVLNEKINDETFEIGFYSSVNTEALEGLTLKEWQEKVNDEIGYNIDWKKVEQEGSVTVCW